MNKVGTKYDVMNGYAKMTGGGLKKKDLLYTENGKIISKKMLKASQKRMKSNQKGGVFSNGKGKKRCKKGFFDLHGCKARYSNKPCRLDKTCFNTTGRQSTSTGKYDQAKFNEIKQKYENGNYNELDKAMKDAGFYRWEARSAFTELPRVTERSKLEETYDTIIRRMNDLIKRSNGASAKKTCKIGNIIARGAPWDPVDEPEDNHIYIIPNILSSEPNSDTWMYALYTNGIFIIGTVNTTTVRFIDKSVTSGLIRDKHVINPGTQCSTSMLPKFKNSNIRRNIAKIFGITGQEINRLNFTPTKGIKLSHNMFNINTAVIGNQNNVFGAKERAVANERNITSPSPETLAEMNAWHRESSDILGSSNSQLNTSGRSVINNLRQMSRWNNKSSLNPTSQLYRPKKTSRRRKKSLDSYYLEVSGLSQAKPIDIFKYHNGEWKSCIYEHNRIYNRDDVWKIYVDIEQVEYIGATNIIGEYTHTKTTVKIEQGLPLTTDFNETGGISFKNNIPTDEVERTHKLGHYASVKAGRSGRSGRSASRRNSTKSSSISSGSRTQLSTIPEGIEGIESATAVANVSHNVGPNRAPPPRQNARSPSKTHPTQGMNSGIQQQLSEAPVAGSLKDHLIKLKSTINTSIDKNEINTAKKTFIQLMNRQSSLTPKLTRQLTRNNLTNIMMTNIIAYVSNRIRNIAEISSANRANNPLFHNENNVLVGGKLNYLCGRTSSGGAKKKGNQKKTNSKEKNNSKKKGNQEKNNSKTKSNQEKTNSKEKNNSKTKSNQEKNK